MLSSSIWKSVILGHPNKDPYSPFVSDEEKSKFLKQWGRKSTEILQGDEEKEDIYEEGNKKNDREALKVCGTV